MKPKTRRLLKENNALDARLSPESQAVMTDIVCYLRAANIGVCQQELLRRDITEMLLDGEADIGGMSDEELEERRKKLLAMLENNAEKKD